MCLGIKVFRLNAQRLALLLRLFDYVFVIIDGTYSSCGTSNVGAGLAPARTLVPIARCRSTPGGGQPRPYF